MTVMIPLQAKTSLPSPVSGHGNHAVGSPAATPVSSYPLTQTGKQRRKSPSSRYRRTVPISANKPLPAKARHDLLQLLTNHRTDLELLEIVTQAIIDLLNKRATPANREDALDFFRGEVYAIYMSMLDLGYMGFPQAIEALLHQSGAIQGHETPSAKE